MRKVIRDAIKCGPIPKIRDWRKLAPEKWTRAERNMAFVERHCVVPEGPLVGQNIKLADFQEAFFYAVYDNKVPTKKALLSIARKNSKTATIATIVLIHGAGPEAKLNSRINSGARSRKQAAEVYNYASKMIKLSVSLRKICRTVDSAKRIIFLPMNVEYEALSAEGSTAHGGSPVVAIVAFDTHFHEALPRMFPHNPGAKSWFDGEANRAARETGAFRNGTLQGAYLIMAARAVGLDCGPMSGFDNAKVDAEFFPDGHVRSNFLCSLGHGDPETIFARGPRFGFDEACQIL